MTVEHRPDGVALVQLDRPKANALSAAVLGQLQEVASGLAEVPPGAVVLWGGRRIFAAGADIVELETIGAEAVGRNFAAALDALAAVPRVTIAAVNGIALGGGLELALACDFRVGAEDSRFGVPEILLGIIPGGGGTQRLPRLVGRARATRMLLLGERLRAPQALAAGLVDETFSNREALLAGARELGGRLAAMPAPGVRLIKRCLNDGYDPSLAHGLEVERTSAIVALAQPEAREGLRAFLEKREPRFHG